MKSLTNLYNYLSKDSINKISLYKHTKKDGMIDEDICLLTDGTVITVNTVRGGLKLPEGFLHNPNNIKIENECMIIVKFKPNESDENYMKVRFRVDSMIDLENQWRKFRNVKELGDIYGIIDEVSMTKEQMSVNSKMVMLVNEWLNIILKDNIDIFNCPIEFGKQRYELIRSIITNTVNSLIISGAFEKLYCPTLIKNEDGETTSVIDTIDIDFLTKNLHFNEEYPESDE